MDNFLKRFKIILIIILTVTITGIVTITINTQWYTADYFGIIKNIIISRQGPLFTKI